MNDKNISILLPTRARVLRLTNFLLSADATASGKHKIEVILGIDEDDEETKQFEIELKTLTYKKSIAPRNSMGAINTRCFNDSSHDILILCNDDVTVCTESWDEKIINAASRYAQDVYLLYPKDGHKSSSLSTFPIISRRCANLLAWPYPKQYMGSLIDLHIYEIFQRLNKLGYDVSNELHNVFFEHEHLQKDPSMYDATYADRKRFIDDSTFYSLLYLRRAQARVLIEALSGKKYPKITTNEIISRKMNIISFISKIYLDRGLPLRFRFKHASWMLIRKVYAVISKDVMGLRKTN